MKSAMRFLALIFGVLMLATSVYAESPREQLEQMVEQLQKTPADDALREKTIKLAHADRLIKMREIPSKTQSESATARLCT